MEHPDNRASHHQDNDKNNEEIERGFANPKNVVPPRRDCAFHPPNTPTPPPPLGLTGVVCQSNTLARGARGVLHYTVYRPRHWQYRPPLICVAGGPGLPSPYLSPLVHLVQDRAIVLYDHVGCGLSLLQSASVAPPQSSLSLSTTPPHAAANAKASNNAPFDLTEMVQDLACLVQHLACPSFHLFGHSFGGILVYEYCRRYQHHQRRGRDSADTTRNPQHEIPRQTCQSVILASTPTSVPLIEATCQALQELIREELTNIHESEAEVLGQIFSSRHECRIEPLPWQLRQSFQSAGLSSTSKGFRAVRDYAVPGVITHRSGTPSASSTGSTSPITDAGDDNTPPQGDNDALPVLLQIPALILRGQYDFVTPETCQGWTDLWDPADFVTLAGCAHYAMLENEDLFGDVVRPFIQQHEPPPQPLVFKRTRP